jgi:hypothetical protein
MVRFVNDHQIPRGFVEPPQKKTAVTVRLGKNALIDDVKSVRRLQLAPITDGSVFVGRLAMAGRNASKSRYKAGGPKPSSRSDRFDATNGLPFRVTSRMIFWRGDRRKSSGIADIESTPSACNSARRPELKLGMWNTGSIQ